MTCAPQSSKVGRVSHMKICMTAVHQPIGILISKFFRTTARFCATHFIFKCKVRNVPGWHGAYLSDVLTVAGGTLLPCTSMDLHAHVSSQEESKRNCSRRARSCHSPDPEDHRTTNEVAFGHVRTCGGHVRVRNVLRRHGTYLFILFSTRHASNEVLAQRSTQVHPLRCFHEA